MDKIPWQGYLVYNETSYIASTSLVLDKKYGSFSDFEKITKFLDGYRKIYTKAYHIAFAELTRGASLKNTKQRICKELSVKSRVADSAIAEAKGKIKAKRELMKQQVFELSYELKLLKSELEKLYAEYTKFLERNKDVDWSKPTKGKTPALKKYKKRIYYTKNKINKLKIKLENIKKALKNKHYKVCFGSCKLLSYRHKLDNHKIKYNSYVEWKDAWDNARIRHIFVIGTTGDTYGSQLLKMIPKGNGYYNLKITDYHTDVLRGTSLEYVVKLSYLEDVVNKTVLNNQTISYYIVLDKGRYYVKPAVEREGKPKDMYTKGCYGIDINDGFLSITKVQNSGNLLEAKDIIFETKGSREQNIDSLTNILVNIHRKATKERYKIAIEGINLTRKKIQTSNRKMNRILHLFPYSRYVELSKRMSINNGSILMLVHPAYTSQIGREKYKDVLDITDHQSASYVIARRALGFEETYTKK